MADAIRDLQRRAENAEREVRHLVAENQALRTRAELAERRLAGFDGPAVAAATRSNMMGGATWLISNRTAAQPKSADLLYSVPAIGAYMGLTERQARYLCQKGTLPSFKIDGTVWRLAFRDRRVAGGQTSAIAKHARLVVQQVGRN